MFWYNCLYCAISWDYARLIYLLLNSLNKPKEIFNKTKVEEKQELIHMMNIVGNQIIHEAADHYGWKEGSTEKLLLHGAIGTLTGSMSGGNALSGAVSGSVNEFALAYIEKTKGRNWMDTHPDTVQAISTALGAVAGSLTGDRTTGTGKRNLRIHLRRKYELLQQRNRLSETRRLYTRQCRQLVQRI